MSHMSNIAHIQTCWNLQREKVKPTIIAKGLGVHKATVYRWMDSFKRRGYKRTINHYKNCKKHTRKKKITRETRLKIFELRKRHYNCCGEKIQFYLKKETGVRVSVPSIYRILKTKLEIKNKYKGRKYGEAPKGKYERDVIQTDTVDFGEVYAYTYVDTYTRQAFVDLELGLEAEDGYASLTEAKRIFKTVRLLQNDGGPEFKAEFKEGVSGFAREHRVSRPYKKNEQSYIESFNRTLRKECLGWRKYRTKELSKMKQIVCNWLEYYNNERAHLSLNMSSPNKVAICRI